MPAVAGPIVAMTTNAIEAISAGPVPIGDGSIVITIGVRRPSWRNGRPSSTSIRITNEKNTQP